MARPTHQFPKSFHQERMKLGTPSGRTLFLLKSLAWLATSNKERGGKTLKILLLIVSMRSECIRIAGRSLRICLHSAPSSEYLSGKLMQA